MTVSPGRSPPTNIQLSFLAGALAGGRLAVEETSGAAAYTDGQSVFVPTGVDPAALVRMVTVQGALVGAGSLAPEHLKRLRGPATAERYLVLETQRAATALAHVLPPSVAHAIRAATLPVTAPLDPTDSLRRALGVEPVPQPPDWFGTIAVKELRARGSAYSLAGPPSEHDRFARPDPQDRLEGDDAQDTDEPLLAESRLARLLRTPLNMYSPLATLLGSETGTSRKRASASDGAEMAVNSAQLGDRAGPTVRLARALTRLRRGASTVQGGTMYPEWDVIRSAYRPGWCRVVEYDAAPGSDPATPSSLDVALRRQLVRVSRALVKHRRQERGDALDLDALVDQVVQRHAGVTTNVHIYQARLRTAPELGLLILLDASGSTGEIRPAGHTALDEQRTMAVELLAACEAVGLRVAAYAFHSEGRQAVRLIRVKTFDERFGQAARARIAGLQPSGFTRMGAALRHATQIVAREAGMPRQLILTVSDGLPYDGPDYENTYAEADTRMALAEARERGVAAACINVATARDDDRLERIFGATAHLRVTCPDDLVDHVRPLLTGALSACR